MLLQVTRNGQVLKNEVIQLKAQSELHPEDEERVPYLSLPIRIKANSDQQIKFVRRNEEIILHLQPKDQVTARPTAKFLRLKPHREYGNSITILGSHGNLWKKALNRVADCNNVRIKEGLDIFARKSSQNYSKYLLNPLDLGKEEIRISHGDHAAVLILKDEIVALLNVIQKNYDHHLKITTNDRILNFFTQANSEETAFWKKEKFQTPDGSEILLADLLNVRKCAKEWGISYGQAKEYTIKEMRRVLEELSNRLQQSVNQLNQLECDPAKLISLIGYQSDQINKSIIPKLIQPDNNNLPDHTAIAHVKSLAGLGNAIRALETYGKLNDTFQAGVLGFLGASAGLFRSIEGLGAAIAYFTVGIEVVDLAYFGSKALIDYQEGKNTAAINKNLSHVMGQSFLKEAKLEDPAWYEPWISIVLPGLGVRGSIKNLKNVKAIEKGKKLARQIKVLDENSILKLSKEDQADLQAFTQFKLNGNQLTPQLSKKEETYFKRLSEKLASVPEKVTVVAKVPDKINSTKLRQVGVVIETADGLNPVIKQADCNSCGNAILETILQRTETIIPSTQQLPKVFGQNGATTDDFVEAIEATGLSASIPFKESTKGTSAFLRKAREELNHHNQLATIVNYYDDAKGGLFPHWVTIEKVTSGVVKKGKKTIIDGPYMVIGDPKVGKSVAISQKDFLKHWEPRTTVVVSRKPRMNGHNYTTTKKTPTSSPIGKGTPELPKGLKNDYSGEELREVIKGDFMLDAYEFLSQAPDLRKNIETLRELSKVFQRPPAEISDILEYKTLSEIDRSTVEHIFRGHHSNGRHHISALIDDNDTFLVDVMNKTNDGFYEAILSNEKIKSFWPDNWDEYRVIDELEYVFRNAEVKNKNTLFGYTKTGRRIRIIINDLTDTIITAFPDF